EVEIEIIDPQTAVVVDSQSFDLETSTALASDIRLTMLLPDPTKVYTLRATADLDPGEMLVVDGIEINLN
ncbi:MAG: hypothetical protein QGF46_03740, partial [Planctomycetota bacterium]|nr:hypothetical protein [Planctomycetota bacterium]